MNLYHKISLVTKEMEVRVPLVFESQSTVTDVVQVLEPLKVGYCHTTGIDVKILKVSTIADQMMMVIILNEGFLE